MPIARTIPFRNLSYTLLSAAISDLIDIIAHYSLALAPTYLLALLNHPSSTVLEDEEIYVLNTNLALPKNVLVIGRLKECRGRAVVYLSTKAIAKTRFNVCDAGFKGGYYDAELIYALAVDGLNSL